MVRGGTAPGERRGHCTFAQSLCVPTMIGTLLHLAAYHTLCCVNATSKCMWECGEGERGESTVVNQYSINEVIGAIS